MDREAWRAAIHGVTKSWTRLSDWSDWTDWVVLSHDPSDTSPWPLPKSMTSSILNSSLGVHSFLRNSFPQYTHLSFLSIWTRAQILNSGVHAAYWARIIFCWLFQREFSFYLRIVQIGVRLWKSICRIKEDGSERNKWKLFSSLRIEKSLRLLLVWCRT